MIRPVDTEGRAYRAPLKRPPALVIRLALEERPLVFIETLNEGEENRLRDWVHANERVLELVVRALDLAGEARAA